MMMIMGEGGHHTPTVHGPPWSMFDDPTEGIGYSVPVSRVTGGTGDFSPYLLGEAAIAALQRYLPSDDPYAADAVSNEPELADAPVDAFSCDEFRMYEFKVRRCARGRSHDWTECPYAHPGEKARRRDPRKYHYTGTACPDFRKGNCKRGDACEFAHGVFECWLHPARYRTQPCKDGTACRRLVCFFAHTPEQLRVLPQQQQSSRGYAAPESYDGSPLSRHSLDAYFPKSLMSSSPTSTLIPPPVSPLLDSPPLSPSVGSARRAWTVGGSSVNEVLASLRQLQLSKVKSMPSSWGFQGTSLFGSPTGDGGVRAGFSSLPSTPTRAVPEFGGGAGWLDGDLLEDEAVESERALRGKMFERLSMENGMKKPEPAGPPLDVDWVSDLVK